MISKNKCDMLKLNEMFVEVDDFEIMILYLYC